jgi:hypothetical protein
VRHANGRLIWWTFGSQFAMRRRGGSARRRRSNGKSGQLRDRARCERDDGTCDRGDRRDQRPVDSLLPSPTESSTSSSSRCAFRTSSLGRSFSIGPQTVGDRIHPAAADARRVVQMRARSNPGPDCVRICGVIKEIPGRSAPCGQGVSAERATGALRSMACRSAGDATAWIRWGTPVIITAEGKWAASFKQ